MKIAIIGSGRVGSALAGAFVSAGHTVTFGSRDPGSKSGLVAPALAMAEAVEGAELVVVATPGGQALEALEKIGADVLSDKVLLDVSNAVDEHFNLLYPNDSVARKIQERFPAVKVVKTLNTMSSVVMINPRVLSSETTVFLSGNDAAAKSVVSGLLVELGWAVESQLDLGDISTARGTEHYILLFAAVAGAAGSGTFNPAIILS